MSEVDHLDRLVPDFSDACDVDTASAQYARRFAGPVGAYFLEVQARMVLRLLQPFEGARVLDVGGGHAQVTGPLLAAGYRVEVAGSVSGLQGGWSSVPFHRAALPRLPFPDRSFGVVLGLRLISHIVHWPQLLSEMCRVADRAVLLDYADLRSVNVAAGPLYGLKRRVEGGTRRYRCFTRRELGRHLEGLGFPDVVFRPQFFLPMAAHRALRARAFTRALEGACRTAGLTRVLGSPVLLRAVRRESWTP